VRGLISSLPTQLEASHIVAPSPLFPFLLAARAAEHPLFVVTSSSRSSEDLVNELRELHNNVVEFPAWLLYAKVARYLSLFAAIIW
jgi:transcription-repair coupling factor (superfamily II helicase)